MKTRPLYKKAKESKFYQKFVAKAHEELIADDIFSIADVLTKLGLEVFIGSKKFRPEWARRMIEEQHNMELIPLCELAFTRKGRKAPAGDQLAVCGRATAGYALVSIKNEGLVDAWHSSKEGVASGVTDGANKTRDYAIRSGIDHLASISVVRQEKLPPPSMSA